MAQDKMIDCGTRRKFIWKHLTGKSEVTTPNNCKECSVEQLNYCVAKSLIAEGKDAKTTKARKVILKEQTEAEVDLTEPSEEAGETQDEEDDKAQLIEKVAEGKPSKAEGVENAKA
jgi:hypothetical protein